MAYFRIVFSLLLFFYSHKLFSQGNQWVWMHGGTTTPTSATIYGTQGVANAANQPGSRYEGVEWTDKFGNFWLMSGNITSNNTDAMWKYDPSIDQWTWMSGDSTNSFPVYGVQGVFSPLNRPGSRQLGTVSWTDTSGFLWMFGGNGWDSTNYWGPLADLWKYDPDPSSSTYKQWQWVKGPGLTGWNIQPGVYGTKQVASANNNPGARCENSCSWVDNDNNLWLFGGQAVDVNGGPMGAINDLWKYDISTNQWTWMSGDSLIVQPGVYGTKGVSSAANKPGGRWVYSSWKDKDGNLWLFGGESWSAFNVKTGDLNDLWKYDISTNQWTWMSGSNQVDHPGSYGARCVEATTNSPKARTEGRARWTDDCGNFWLFGANAVSDLWKYNPSKNTWTLVNGSAANYTNNVFGVMKQPASANKPSGRMGAHPWRTKDGLWMLGGQGGNTFSALWKYIPDSIIVDFSYVLDKCLVSFTDQSSFTCNEIKSYSWNFGDPASGVNDTSSLLAPDHLFGMPGNYDVKLVITSCTGRKDSVVKTILVPVITEMYSDTTICINGSSQDLIPHVVDAKHYLWSTGETTQQITITSAGNYYVAFEHLCDNVTDTVYFFVDECLSTIYIPRSFTPNGDGLNDLFMIYGNLIEAMHLRIVDRWGELVFETNDLQKGWDGRYNGVDVSEGVYVYKVDYQSDQKSHKKLGHVVLIR